MSIKYSLTCSPNGRWRHDNRINFTPSSSFENNVIHILMNPSRRQRMIRTQIPVTVDRLRLDISTSFCKIDKNTCSRCVNNDRFTLGSLRPFFKSRNKCFGTFGMVRMRSMEYNIVFRGNVGEMRRIEVGDNGLYTSFCFEFFRAGLIADNCGDIVFFELENVMEDLSTNEACST